MNLQNEISNTAMAMAVAMRLSQLRYEMVDGGGDDGYERMLMVMV